jgi:hypothetical protein
MTRAERWMSRVLPPRVVWASVVVIIAALYGVSSFYEFVEKYLDADFNKQDPYTVFYASLALTLAGYGVWRANMYPALDEDYANWLATTPWEVGRRLPAGPVLLVWQDACVVAALTAACMIPGGETPLKVVRFLPLFFFMTYIYGLSVGNFNIRQDAAVVGALAALATVPLAVGRSGGLTFLWLFTLVAFVATTWGVLRALREFPWLEKRRSGVLGEWIAKSGEPTIAPPLVHSQQVSSTSPLNWSTVSAISVLSGWAAFTGVECFDRLRGLPRETAEFWLAATMLGLTMALIRMSIYISRHHSPLSLLGRIATGRVLIPGYDRVYMAPAAVLLTSILVPLLLSRLAAPAPVIAGATVSATFFVAFGAGPSLIDWHLTGDHRLIMSRPRRTSTRTDRRAKA